MPSLDRLDDHYATAAGEPLSPKLRALRAPSIRISHYDLTTFDPWLTSIPLWFAGEDTVHRPSVIVKKTRRSVDLSWFEKAMQPANAPLKPADVVPVITGLSEMLKACYFGELDHLLRRYVVNEAPPEMMVALLRTTFPLRHKHLRNWSRLLRDVRSELANRKLDGDKILRGLS